MLNNSILPMRARLAPAREGSWRRTSHGGSAFSSEALHVQPQDGASIAASSVSAINARASHAEPEDARLTGLTRSLFRRLNGLNVMTAVVPATPSKALALRKPSRMANLPQTQVA